MRYLLVLLLLCGQCVAQDKAEFSELTGPVLKIRVMKQGKCPKGIPCAPVFVAGGSCVLVDAQKDREVKGRTTYAVLSAAHVVTQGRKPVSETEQHWTAYPTDHYPEVQVDGKWQSAQFKYVSKYTDITLLTLTTTKDGLKTVKVSETRPKEKEVLRIVGYKGGETLAASAGVSLWQDEGQEQLDAANKLTEKVVQGQSGGAVLNASGELVGVVVGYPDYSPDDIALFTSQYAIKRFMDYSWNKK
jgi:hypothetical protein